MGYYHFYLFCTAGDWTQDLIHNRQELYFPHIKYFPSIKIFCIYVIVYFIQMICSCTIKFGLLILETSYFYKQNCYLIFHFMLFLRFWLKGYTTFIINGMAFLFFSICLVKFFYKAIFLLKAIVKVIHCFLKKLPLFLLYISFM